MRNFFSIILIYSLTLLLTFQPLFSETIDLDNLVERENKWYKKFTNTPFTGIVESYDDDGGLEQRFELVNGLKQGE